MLSNFQVLIVMGILLVLLIGFVALPASKKIVRKSYIDATPENVYNLLVSTEGFQTFNPYKDSDSNLKIMPFGPATVVGAGFKFNGKEGRNTDDSGLKGKRICHHGNRSWFNGET